MFYAITWFLSFILLALWSLACWGAHAVTVWALSSAGTLANGTTSMDAVLLPEWIRGWIPPQLAQEFASMITTLASVVQAARDTVPALSGAVSVLAWVIWGLGALVLLAFAVGAHILIAVFKRRKTSSGVHGAAATR